jgi:hypothetical protein
MVMMMMIMMMQQLIYSLDLPLRRVKSFSVPFLCSIRLFYLPSYLLHGVRPHQPHCGNNFLLLACPHYLENSSSIFSATAVVSMLIHVQSRSRQHANAGRNKTFA